MQEIKFRNKEIELIKKFYRICKNHQDVKFLPFVVCGNEISAEHQEILSYFSNLESFSFERSINIFCIDFQYDIYYELKEIYNNIKHLFSSHQKETFANVIEEFEKPNDKLSKKESETEIISDFCEVCIEISLKHKIMIIVDNFHCASLAFLVFVKKFYKKISSLSDINYFQFHFLLFYKLEDFIDNNIKKIITDISVKGLAFNLRGLQSTDFIKLISKEYLDYLGIKNHNHFWQITKGNIKLIKLIISYFSQIKSEKVRHQLFNKIKSIDDFFKHIENSLSTLEKNILEIIALIYDNVECEFLAYVLETTKEDVVKVCQNLVKKDLLIQDSDENNYMMNSIEFRNYIIFATESSLRIAKYNSLLIAYEKFYEKEIENHIFVLKELSLKAKNRKKSKFYISVLERFLPEKHNIFKKIEILTLLLNLEENKNKQAELVLKIAKLLIGSGKYLSATELLQNYNTVKEINNAKLLELNIVLLELYYLIDDLAKIKKNLPFIDKLINYKLPEILVKKYIKIKIRFFMESGKYNKSLMIFENAISTFSIFKKKEILLHYDKAAILMETGRFYEARAIYQHYLKRFVKEENIFKHLLILYKSGLLELKAANFDKSEEYFIQLLTISSKNEFQSKNTLLVYTKVRLAQIYLETNNSTKFLKYIYEAFNNYNTNNRALASIIYENLGEFYFISNSYEKAVSCFKNARNNFIGKQNIYKKIHYSLKLAECYCKFDKKEKGFNEYNKIVILNKELKNEFFWNMTFLSMSRSSLYLNDSKACLSYLDQVQNSAKNILLDLEKQLITYCYAKKIDEVELLEEINQKLLKIPKPLLEQTASRKQRLLNIFNL